jgi:3alpha(or 20beta)-hydroxysteroid dehydrogenase
MMQPAAWGDFDVRPMMAQAAPLGRMGRPEEVAELVCWLTSDASSYCTGGDYPIDGGVLAGPIGRLPSASS